MIIRATGQVEPLDFANFPLGMFPGIEFEVRSAQLEPGDQVFIFSDGVTEAQNAAHDFFGDERLTALLEKCGAQPGHSLCTMVVGAVRQFVGEAPPADDLTVTALRFVRPVDASADDQE